MMLDTVSTVHLTWSEAEAGLGVQQVDEHVIDPVPRVSEPPSALTAGPAGNYESGDRFVSKISATYTREELSGGDLDSDAREFFWIVNGDQYRIVGEPRQEYLEWKVHLRRRAQ